VAVAVTVARRCHPVDCGVSVTSERAQQWRAATDPAREADASVLVLRSTDFYGPERYEPFETGSRLLYVVLTRARRETVVLLFGDDPQPLVAPLAKLAA
jgi:hypothetical protein